MSKLVEYVHRIMTLSGVVPIIESKEEPIPYTSSNPALFAELKKRYINATVESEYNSSIGTNEENWYTKPGHIPQTAYQIEILLSRKKINNVVKWLISHGASDINRSKSTLSVYVTLRHKKFRISDHLKPTDNVKFDEETVEVLVNWDTPSTQIADVIRKELAEKPTVYLPSNEALYEEGKKSFSLLTVQMVKVGNTKEEQWFLYGTRNTKGYSRKNFIKILVNSKALKAANWIIKKGAVHFKHFENKRSFYMEYEGQEVWVTANFELLKTHPLHEEDHHHIEIFWFTTGDNVAKQFKTLFS